MQLWIPVRADADGLPDNQLRLPRSVKGEFALEQWSTTILIRKLELKGRERIASC